ncbi:7366_t:CDS:2 [Funneliformis caledonium]|uniref:7366_t:CDS:1 n=1 Tax=Funneliformis caledonium TaxID=1117310 RepID=A0A9N9HK83_9GLOM|nr:7366_t:CDS:2 [Funneliformis caledonium]
MFKVLCAITIMQLDGYVLTGCQAICCVMNEKVSESVLYFWTMTEKKRYGDRINIAKANGVLRILEATTASQQHVFTITTKIIEKYNLNSKISLFELSQYTLEFLENLTDDRKRNQAQ